MTRPSRPLNTGLSTAGTDADWDDFLESTEQGQFQQSSHWALYKQADGWRVNRGKVWNSGSLVGGFQFLWKETRFGRIGYLSKGPVLISQDERSRSQVIELLLGEVSRLHLRALLQQSPDENEPFRDALQEHGFLPAEELPIIQATLTTDLSVPWERVWRSVHPKTRYTVRKGRRELRIRRGDSRDLPVFFRLMQQSCLRQKAMPNPHSLESLRHLWSAFTAQGLVRLTVAEISGQTTAGLLSLRFGNRISLFKIGWDGRNRALSPIYVLFAEAMEWANCHGCTMVDVVGCDRRLVTALLREEALSGELLRCRDVYKVGFGGKPRLLPVPTIWFRHSALRATWRLLHRSGASEKFFRLIN